MSLRVNPGVTPCIPVYSVTLAIGCCSDIIQCVQQVLVSCLIIFFPPPCVFIMCFVEHYKLKVRVDTIRRTTHLHVYIIVRILRVRAYTYLPWNYDFVPYADIFPYFE